MLSSDAILEAWERGRLATPARRAILTLEAAGRLDAASLTLAERDRALLDEHGQTFGGVLEATVACPACGEALEFGVPASELTSEAIDAGASVADAWTGAGDLEATVRRLTAGDVAEASEVGDLAAVREAILQRAVAGVARGGHAVQLSALSVEEMAEIASAAEGRQPEPIELALACAACGHSWQTPLDVTAFVWAEIDAAARRLLGEIHQLAQAYGWSEREVLDLGPQRRAAYLRLVAGEVP